MTNFLSFSFFPSFFFLLSLSLLFLSLSFVFLPIFSFHVVLPFYCFKYSANSKIYSIIADLYAQPAALCISTYMALPASLELLRGAYPYFVPWYGGMELQSLGVRSVGGVFKGSVSPLRCREGWIL